MARGGSINALLTPRLRVSRPVAACSGCRAAKIKCDGKLPACTSCERSGKSSACSAASDDFARGKERNYVVALEAASEKLQSRIEAARNLQFLPESTRRDAIAASRMLGPGQAFSSQSLPSSRSLNRKEASDVDNLVGDFGFLSINATSRDFHGFTASTSFARLLLAVSKTGEPLQMETGSLPARHTISHPIQQYLDFVFVLLPFFSETDLMASVSAIYVDSGRYAKAADHWMVRMILAVVYAFWSHEKGDQSHLIARKHVATALGYADEVLHPGSIAGIQALLLLVQYSMLDPDLFSCWHLIGFASRIMVDLGLHQDPAAEVRIGKVEIEMRRRVFYCVYNLDRSISMALNRAFSYTDDSASVKLPTLPESILPTDPSRKTEPQLFLQSSQPSLYLFQIRRVQSSIYQQIWSSSRSQWPDTTAASFTQSAITEIDSWFDTVPNHVGLSHTSVFRRESLYSRILALAPSCRVPNITEHSRFLIFEAAIQFIDLWHPVIHRTDLQALFLLTDSLNVHFVGRQFVRVLWERTDQLLQGTLLQGMSEPSPQASRSTPESESPSPPPPITHISRALSVSKNSARAICCLERTTEILAYARSHFGNSCTALHSDFERDAAILIDLLRKKQQDLEPVQRLTTKRSRRRSPPQAQQQAQQQPLQTLSQQKNLSSSGPGPANPRLSPMQNEQQTTCQWDSLPIDLRPDYATTTNPAQEQPQLQQSSTQQQMPPMIGLQPGYQPISLASNLQQRTWRQGVPPICPRGYPTPQPAQDQQQLLQRANGLPPNPNQLPIGNYPREVSSDFPSDPLQYTYAFLSQPTHLPPGSGSQAYEPYLHPSPTHFSAPQPQNQDPMNQQ